MRSVIPMVHDSILHTIGNTPLVQLGRIGRDCPARIVAKLEMRNPISVKP